MKHTKAQNNQQPARIGEASVSRAGTEHAPSEASIRERAYSIHASHAESSGSASSDWFEAERQLRSESQVQGDRPRS